MKSYRDYLALKGLEPIVIERTVKAEGDWVVVSSYLPAQIVPASPKKRNAGAKAKVAA
jgi:hypothetical protein